MASNRGSVPSSASNTPSALLARFRWWRTRRRLDRILRDAGFPVDASVFTGNILVSETRYPDGLSLPMVIDADWPGYEC